MVVLKKGIWWFLISILIQMRVIILILCGYFLASAIPIDATDPYQVLQLSPGASRQEIRRAFKELSLQYHPDINPGARKHYQRIIEAY
jgi:preprotein translocase subunit Sec63